jgi:regulator of sirC expression with transglutaminase-like and TPR domain
MVCPFPAISWFVYREKHEEIYIDVFDGGKFYEKNELFTLIANHSEVPLLQEHFKVATKRDIVIRMLKNLVAVSLQQETPSRTLPYLDLLLALSPADPIEHWRRATLHLQSGNRKLAREDLKWLLENRSSGFDLERVEELYRNTQ